MQLLISNIGAMLIYTFSYCSSFPHAMNFCLETSDSHVISGFRDSIEKLRGDLLPPDDGLDLEMYCGEVESFDLNQYCGEMGPCVGQIMSEQMTFSDSEKSLVLAEGFPLDTSPAKSCDNSSVPKISGWELQFLKIIFLLTLRVSETHTDRSALSSSLAFGFFFKLNQTRYCFWAENASNSLSKAVFIPYHTTDMVPIKWSGPAQ